VQIFADQPESVSIDLHAFFRKLQAWYGPGLFFYSIGVCLENSFPHTVILIRR
jgi:hypothetical protein